MMYHSPELEIIGNIKDHTRFDSLRELVGDINTHGYYGGVRLLKASLKTFFDYCQRMKIQLDDRNFTVRYNTDIPHGVGLAGSSAIINAQLVIDTRNATKGVKRGRRKIVKA